jgi:hypothetical protein
VTDDERKRWHTERRRIAKEIMAMYPLPRVYAEREAFLNAEPFRHESARIKAKALPPETWCIAIAERLNRAEFERRCKDAGVTLPLCAGNGF